MAAPRKSAMKLAETSKPLPILIVYLSANRPRAANRSAPQMLNCGSVVHVIWR
jgi:hypothetical protein